MEKKQLHRRNNLIVILIVFMALTGIAGVAMKTAADRGEFDPQAPLISPGTNEDGFAPTTIDDTVAATNCRYGVAYVMGDSLEWVSTLDAGWYLNFLYTAPKVRSAEFVPVLGLKQAFVNGVRQPYVNFSPPLSYYYRDENDRVQPGLGTLITQNQGRLWLVGNEPDVDNIIQSNTMPDVYARAYHQAYYFIKKADPTARVAIGGLSMMTPGRLQYLTKVWDTYRNLYGTNMPVDVWNMHLYILEERNPNNPNQYGDGKIALGTDPALAKLTSFGDDQFCPALGAPDTAANDPRSDVYCRSEHNSIRIFRDQVYIMRQWMKERGQQNKPLIISEFGILYPYLGGDGGPTCEFLQDEHQRCFNPTRVTTFLRDAIAFMENTKDPNLGYPQDENRLVQQWLWYSIVTDPALSGGSSNLIVNNYPSFPPGDQAALTMMGQAFREEATLRVGQENLAAGDARNFTGFAKQPGNLGSAVLTASFRNNGTRSITQPVQVTFYSDANLTQEIGSVVYDPVNSGAITGCTWEGRNNHQVSIVWNNLTVGNHLYWAKIDSGGVVTEINESDNVTSAGLVVIQGNGLYVPVVNR
jgi:hypothetical protein